MNSSIQHVAIIMDGNGRWAEARRHHRIFGHIRGAKVARQIIEESSRLGLERLTLFVFSTENWARPKEEVSFLMRLFARNLKREQKTLLKNNIRFRTIGDASRLPPFVREIAEQTREMTNHCRGMELIFALNYGGKQDILQATRALATQVQNGNLEPDEISESLFASQLSTAEGEEPDLVIRTSGESRISNFYLWQMAYSEIFISPKMWPDFKPEDFINILDWAGHRERRFGQTGAQLKESFRAPLIAATEPRQFK